MEIFLFILGLVVFNIILFYFMGRRNPQVMNEVHREQVNAVSHKNYYYSFLSDYENSILNTKMNTLLSLAISGDYKEKFCEQAENISTDLALNIQHYYKQFGESAFTDPQRSVLFDYQCHAILMYYTLDLAQYFPEYDACDVINATARYAIKSNAGVIDQIDMNLPTSEFARQLVKAIKAEL